jgi:hypothetical protein
MANPSPACAFLDKLAMDVDEMKKIVDIFEPEYAEYDDLISSQPNPFTELRVYLVEDALQAKLSAERHTGEMLRESRAKAIEYLEPQYERIVNTCLQLTESIKGGRKLEVCSILAGQKYYPTFQFHWHPGPDSRRFNSLEFDLADPKVILPLSIIWLALSAIWKNTPDPSNARKNSTRNQTS